MISFNQNTKTFISSLIPNAGFGTKLLGDARDDENVPYEKIVRMEQVHGANIYVHRDNTTFIERMDGLLTYEKNSVLITITADCIPVIYKDKKKELIGISHQGWKGLYKELPRKMIDKMRQEGSHPKDIVVAIGPAIGECCYDIPKERFEMLSRKFPKEIFNERNGSIFLNLTKLSYFQLIESGIPKGNIDFFPFCTFCDDARFFSYRKTKNKEDFSHQFSFIYLN